MEPVKPEREIPITTSLDGWSAVIPGGTTPQMLLAQAVGAGFMGAVPVLVLLSVSPQAAAIGGVALLALWALLMLALVFRSLRSTEVVFSGQDLSLQHLLLGRPWGKPVRYPLARVRPIETVSSPMRNLLIGQYLVPANVTEASLRAFCALFEESRAMAAEQPGIAPIPATLQHLRTAGARAAQEGTPP